MTTSTPKKGTTPPADWQAKFLTSLARYGNVSAAAKAAQVSRTFVYAQRDGDPAFADAWDDALEVACDGLEREAWRRATAGVKRTKGVYYKDEQIATEVETTYSDTLLIFLLKAHRPGKFRETIRNEHTGADGGPIEHLDLSDDERSDRITALLERARARRAGSVAGPAVGPPAGAADPGAAE